MPASSPVLFAPTLPQLEKPLMVLLPGLDGTGRLFDLQVRRLSPYFDLRCLMLPEANRQSWQTLSARVAELIRDEQLSRVTYLCGESYGGCLALQIAVSQPSLVERLVLINPASSLRSQFWAAWMTRASRYVPEWIYRFSGSVALSLLANFDRIQEDWQRRFIETVRPISQDCVTWRLTMLEQFEIAPQVLRRLTIPTALIASASDRLLPSVQEVERLQMLLPQSITHRLPGSGHVCLIEEAIDLAQCLKRLDFLPEVSLTKV